MLFLYLGYVEIFPRTPTNSNTSSSHQEVSQAPPCSCASFLWVAASGHGDGTDPPLHGSSRIRNSVLKLSFFFSSLATLVTGCVNQPWP